MDIFESLENLPVSEECFDEIMGTVEETISEYLTVGDVKNAAKSALKNRMQQYRSANSNPNVTPFEKKRLSDRVDKASKIKDALINRGYKDTTRAGSNVRNAIKEITMSPEEAKEAKRNAFDDKARERQKEVGKMWSQMPSHTGAPNGFRYRPKLKTNK